MKENYWNQSISNTIHVQSECSSVKKRHLFCPKSDKYTEIKQILYRYFHFKTFEKNPLSEFLPGLFLRKKHN